MLLSERFLRGKNSCTNRLFFLHITSTLINIHDETSFYTDLASIVHSKQYIFQIRLIDFDKLLLVRAELEDHMR